MIDKRVRSLAEMMSGVEALRDGAVLLVGGFGNSGIPELLLEGVAELGLRDLTVVSNNAGSGRRGIALLLESGAVSRMMCSYPRVEGSVVFEELYQRGALELELVPQGTLAERLRAGGAGIPAFYTPTAAGTELAAGRVTRELEGRPCVLERAIRGDVALVHADAADRWGNLTYSKTARNFNPVMAMAAGTTLVEARRFVDAIDPEVVVSPGVFVDRVIELPAERRAG
jgi:3-oxoadipate CoA-transferase alpha subunit